MERNEPVRYVSKAGLMTSPLAQLLASDQTPVKARILVFLLGQKSPHFYALAAYVSLAFSLTSNNASLNWWNRHLSKIKMPWRRANSTKVIFHFYYGDDSTLVTSIDSKFSCDTSTKTRWRSIATILTLHSFVERSWLSFIWTYLPLLWLQ